MTRDDVQEILDVCGCAPMPDAAHADACNRDHMAHDACNVPDASERAECCGVSLAMPCAVWCVNSAAYR